jgi:hypothetical protein
MLPFGTHQPAGFIAPVVFIIFRRPDTTSRVFEEIRKAKPSKLYVIADGPRLGNKEEVALSSQTRAVIDGVDWPCDVTKIYAEENLGLRERIMTGLDSVFELEEQAIILEDDCLPSSSFFTFCSELLQKYKNYREINLISGSNFAPQQNMETDYFFSHSMYIWGWATWSDSWREFRKTPQVERWPPEEKVAIADSFASRVQKSEFFKMMDSAKNLNTWDISLAVWMRQFNKLSIIPRLNLIENIGFGEDATHTKFEAFDVQVRRSDFSGQIRHPEALKVSPALERRMWRVKSLRWLTFPLSHPLEFIGRMSRFLLARYGDRTQVQPKRPNN